TCVSAAGNDAANLTVCAQTELNRQDARLNQMYRKRMSQISGDAAATTSLRSDERKWIRARDAKCTTDSVCLLKETHDRADFLAGLVSSSPSGETATTTAAPVGTPTAGTIPAELIGTWTVVKTLPTKTISCWGEAEAKTVIGTDIVYTADSFQWKDAVAKDPKVTKAVLSAHNFALNNSGGGANDSNVSFKQLGITSSRAAQITIEHADANVTGGTTEIPGDVVILRDPTHLVFSVCNLYFLAQRKP
ncbi:MAG: lysozyme inhibitor LprI family protein, partial [Candidatus Acidiferrales bacterium]